MNNLPKIKPLLAETYLAVIKNSVGSKTWQTFYALVDNQKTDIMKAGDLSCAFFVSSILTQFGLIERIHGTVDGTVFDLEKSGWQKSENLAEIKSGSVLVWRAKVGKDGENHKHLGFYIGDNQAISNSSETGQIAQHHFTYGQTETGEPVRAIEAIYTHSKLN